MRWAAGRDACARRSVISGVTVDSRAAEGRLSSARHGVDGAISCAAVEHGAADGDDQVRHAPVSWSRIRQALALAAARFYGNQHRLPSGGVTGTNGKTSTTHLVRAILGMKNEDARTSATGSIGNPHTTPTPSLHAWLRRMLDSGCVRVSWRSARMPCGNIECTG